MFSVSKLPVFITTFQSDLELPDAFKSFQHGRYHKNNTQKVVDKTIRNCQQSVCVQEKFMKMIQPTLTSIVERFNEKIVIDNHQWRVFKYNNGHFVRHVDRFLQRQNQIHIGTLILLPPINKCKYEGGILRIEEKEKTHETCAVANAWTFIFLPLGIYHEVTPVIGTRVSYVKDLYILNLNKEYEIPLLALAGVNPPGVYN